MHPKKKKKGMHPEEIKDMQKAVCLSGHHSVKE